MQLKLVSRGGDITRRSLLAAGAALAAPPALAQTPPFLARKCEVGPPAHDKGPLVFMDYDQIELDAAYHQRTYEPLLDRINQRLVSNSAEVRARIGEPQRVAYGPSGIETLDIYRAGQARAPIFVFIHGGIWLYGSARDCAYAAEMLSTRGRILSPLISPR
jgi:arylformamidase